MSRAPERVEAALLAAGVEVDVRTFPQGTRTAEDAAAAVGVEVGQIVKSLVFTRDGHPVLALVSGSNRADEALLEKAFGGAVGRASADEVRDWTGYSIGGVPPFGHASEVPVFMDRDLLGYATVWAAAGRPDSVFEIAPDRLRTLSNATVLDLKVT